MAGAIKLSKEQWIEIYYALDTKINLMKDGFFGPEDKRGDNKRWAEDMKEIMELISRKVDA